MHLYYMTYINLQTIIMTSEIRSRLEYNDTKYSSNFIAHI